PAERDCSSPGASTRRINWPRGASGRLEQRAWKGLAIELAGGGPPPLATGGGAGGSVKTLTAPGAQADAVLPTDRPVHASPAPLAHVGIPAQTPYHAERAPARAARLEQPSSAA